MTDAIFKAYDIRGTYPSQLNDETAFSVGRGYATLLRRENPKKPLTVVVGSDMRLSSPRLKQRIIEGLTISGVNVVDVGLVSTPTFYFSVAFLGHDGGVQVSASHNPKEDNGFKLVRSRARPIGRGSGMEELKRIVLQQDFLAATTPSPVLQHPAIVKRAVVEEAKGIATATIKPFTVIVDAANAMGALDMEEVFRGLPCTMVPYNFRLDGHFPVHHPDPRDEKNLRFLQEAVLQNKADVGIAPDGDGDRYFFVDETGKLVPQDIVRGLLAQMLLREQPGATICFDVTAGRILKEMVEAAGGKARITPVGSPIVKEIMEQEGAPFGGESSGHTFFRFPFGIFEAPARLIPLLLAFLSTQQQPFSQVVAPYKKYVYSGEINSTVTDAGAILEKIKHAYRDGTISELDGVSVEYPDWWFNVRGSNTEALIRLNLEARSQALMEQKRDEVLEILRR